MELVANEAHHARQRRSTPARAYQQGERRSAGMSRPEIALVVLLIVAVMLAAVLSGALRARTPRIESTNVRVERGASLWSIAEEHPVPGMTVEQTVDFIREVNRIAGDTLVAGSMLRVPSPKPSARALASRVQGPADY